MGAFQFAHFETTSLATRQQRREGHAAAQAFAEGDDVGTYAVLLFGQQRATTTEARLHFIEDQQDPQFTAQALDTLEVVFGRGGYVGALDRLKQDGNGLCIDSSVQGRQVVERHMAETRQLGFEAVFQTTGRRSKRRETAAMAPVAGADDAVGAAAMQLAPFACQLDRRFTGFCATVEQISLVAAGAVAQAVDKVELGAVMQAHAGVDQRMGLFAQGFDQHLRAVAEAVGAIALAEVQIGAVVTVPQPGTLATHKNVRRPRHGGHQGFAGRIIVLRVQDQIIQAWGGAADREQIHRSLPIATEPGADTAF